MDIMIFIATVIFGGQVISAKFSNNGMSFSSALRQTWRKKVINDRKWVRWIIAILSGTIILQLILATFTGGGYGSPSFSDYVFGFLSSLMTLTFWGIIIWVAFRIFGSKGGTDDLDKDIAYGSAEWTPHFLLRNAGITVPPPMDREYLYTGSLYFNTRQGHLITAAGSRSGKGASQIIPNLLLPNRDSFVVIDIKGENAFMTADYQANILKKEVVILDPWNEQARLGATHGISPGFMNPLDFIKANPEEVSDNCQLLASLLVPENPSTKEPFWDDSARSMIKVYLLHLLTERDDSEHTLWTIYQWLRYDGDKRLELWAEMRTSDNEIVRNAVGDFTHFSESSTTLSSIVSSAHNATRFLESETVRETFCTSGFQPYDLPDGGMTLYVVVPERYLKSHARVLRLVVGLCLRACNHKPNKRVNFLIDEAFAIGKMEDIETGFAVAAGNAIRLWLFYQSLSQIQSVYGEPGVNSFTGCQHFMAFGVDCQYTAEKVSKMLGDSTIVVRNTSHTQSRESSSTTTYNKTGRPLLTAEEVGKTADIINFFRDDKVRYKFTGVRWNYFEPSPFRHERNFDPLTDPFERQRSHFMNAVDLMPQHRKFADDIRGKTLI